MKTGLIVNPLAYVIKVSGSEDLNFGGPVPGRGWGPFRLSPDVDPGLHAVLSDFVDIGLGSLDIEKDLHPRQVDLLEKHGVLVRADNVPEQPLFSCMLNDVPESPTMPAKLIVNPTIEFRPFDLTKFRSLVVNHMSPHAATVWIDDPDTEIRWGYWLNPDNAQLVQSLQPGEAVDGKIDPADARRLFAARILIDPSGESSSERRNAIDSAAKKFQAERYAVLDHIIEPPQLTALQSYFRRYVDQGFMIFGDSQVPLRFAQNDEPVAAIVHQGLTSVMSKLAGVAIRPTYSYTAAYIGGADLKPHTDREDCVFSFSLQLDYSPAPDTGISPWALFLAQHNDPKRVDPENDVALHLANGSCLAYMGRELVHYREPLPDGHRSISIFLHYVPA